MQNGPTIILRKTEKKKTKINTISKEEEGTHIRGYHALLTEVNKNTENRFIAVGTGIVKQ